MAAPSGSAAVSSSGTISSSSGSLASVVPWLRQMGIWWDDKLVDIRAGCSGCSGPDLGVFAVTDTTENQLLCMIPRSAILSPRTTRIAALLEQERLGGGLALTIAVMYEASLGSDSKWAGYFASLPCREYLPIFWSDAELDMLQGTALEGRAAGDREDTQDDYETHVVPLMQKYPEAFPHPDRCSLGSFRAAASWVASRCFHVDSWHGDALVPLADIFNHKASVVLLGDAWGVAELADTHEHSNDHEHGHQLDGEGHEHEHEHSEQEDGEEEEEEEEAEGEDGSGHEHEHGSDAGHSEEDADAQHGFAVGGMPIIAAGPAAAAAADGAAANAGRWVRDGINLRLEIGICSMGPPDSRELPLAPGATAAAAVAAGEAAAANEQPAKKRKVQQQQQQEVQHGRQQWPERRLEIVAASAVAAGAEVHNTYGELGNAQLVAKYGFCLPLNPFDEVSLCETWAGFISGADDTAAAPTAAGLQAPAKLKQHVKWLQNNSNLLEEVAEDEESPDPPQITPGGRLNIMTAAVVRLLGASSAQLKQWQGLEDVLQDPGSDEDDAPAAVLVQALPEAAAAAKEVAAGDEEQEAQAVAQHFDDVRISQHDVSWWGRAGLELLAAAVQRRLGRYPASLADDRLALQQQQQQQQQQQRQEGVAAEHVAAVTAALQLRVCEQEALQEVLEAVQKVLGQ